MSETIEWKDLLKDKTRERNGRLWYLAVYSLGALFSYLGFNGFNEDGTPQTILQSAFLAAVGTYCAYKIFSTIFVSNTYDGATVINSAGVKTHQYHCRNIFSELETQEAFIPWGDVLDVSYGWILVTDTSFPGLHITFRKGCSSWCKEIAHIYDDEKSAKSDLVVIERLRAAVVAVDNNVSPAT